VPRDHLKHYHPWHPHGRHFRERRLRDEHRHLRRHDRRQKYYPYWSNHYHFYFGRPHLRRRYYDHR
jgi:hypothetical protein